MTDKTRTLKNLVEEHDSVWIYLEDEKVATAFMRQAISEGFKCANGRDFHSTDGGYLFGIHKDMTIAHLSMYIWCLSFQCHGKIPGTKSRIDFKKYVNGDEDYYCKEPFISGFVSTSS